MDRAVFDWINGWPDGWTPTMRFLSEATNAWPGRLLLLAAVVALVWKPATRLGGFVALLGWPLANAATDVIKAAWPTPRPGNVLPEAIIRIGMSDSSGTASAHSANMMFVGAALWMKCGPAWGAPFVALAVAVGLSRVYVAAHFPSQVLAGWFVGAFCALVVVRTVDAGARLMRRRREGTLAAAPAEHCGEPDAEGA